MTVRKYKLDLKVEEILLEGEGGIEKKMKLIELSGAQRNNYLNLMKGRAKIDKAGKVTISSFDGLQSDLLTKSLFDESGEAATKEFIEELPASTQQSLFEDAQKLSGLDKGAGNKEEDPNV